MKKNEFNGEREILRIDIQIYATPPPPALKIKEEKVLQRISNLN